MRSTLLVTALASVFALGMGAVAADGECNGAKELCDRPYHKVAFAMTHNSYSVGAETAANQNFDVTQQLNDGVRVLNLDAIPSPNGNGGIELCHTSCDLLDAGPATDTLKKVVTWLESNPNEVLTIIWENSQNVNAAAFQQAYTDAGLVQYSYTQDAGSQEWPTLTAIIQGGKRVINFVGAGADSSVPWLHDEFSYVFETPFENSSPDSFSCVVDRPASGGQNLGLYVLNHFLYSNLTIGDTQVEFPDRADVPTTNGKSLEQHVQTCTQTFGRIPNFVAVDFYEQGSANINIMSVVASLNNVEYVPKPLGGPSTDPQSQQVNGNGASRHSLLMPIASYMLGATVALALM